MAVEQTLSIIKPDGVQKNLIGEIYKRFEDAGLEIIAAKMSTSPTRRRRGFMPSTGNGRFSMTWLRT